MPGHYPDKPPQASDGATFAQLGVELMYRFLRERVHVFDDARSQFDIGESREGIEFKELKNSHTRLHIEIRERTGVGNAWVASGIFRNDNSERYCCGNNTDVFLFRRETLRWWFKNKEPLEICYGRDRKTGIYRLGDVDDPDLDATIHSYILHKMMAKHLCLCRFVLTDDWRIQDGYLRQNLTICQVQDLLRSGAGDRFERRALWRTLDLLLGKQNAPRI